MTWRQRPRGSPSREPERAICVAVSGDSNIRGDDTQASRNQVGRTQETGCREIRFHLSMRCSRLSSAPDRVCDSAMKNTIRKNAGNSVAKRSRADFSEPAVDAVFGAHPRPIKAKLLALRRLIFDTAKAAEGIGRLEETEASSSTPRSAAVRQPARSLRPYPHSRRRPCQIAPATGQRSRRWDVGG